MAEKEFQGECRGIDAASGDDITYVYKVIYTIDNPILWSSIISVDGNVKGAPKGKIENFHAGVADIEPLLRNIIETNIVEFVAVSRS